MYYFTLQNCTAGGEKNRCKHYDARVFFSNIGRSMSQRLASESVHNLHYGAKYIYIYIILYVSYIHMYVMCVRTRTTRGARV